MLITPAFDHYKLSLKVLPIKFCYELTIVGFSGFLRDSND